MKDKSILIFKVIFCGPADVESERAIFFQAVDVCSKLLETSGRGIALFPMHWKSEAVVQRCGRAQDAINEQLVGQADALVAAFRSRLGSPTVVADSGTVEEIERAIMRSIPWRAYFYNGELTPSDASQLGKVLEYKRGLQERDFLTPEYTSPMELLLDLVKWLFKVFCSEARTPRGAGQDELDNLLKIHDALSRARTRELARVLYTIAGGSETDALLALACAKPQTFVEFARYFKWKVETQDDTRLREAIIGPLFDEDPSCTIWKKIRLSGSKRQSGPPAEGYVLFDETRPKTVYVNETLQTELDQLLRKLV